MEISTIEIIITGILIGLIGVVFFLYTRVKQVTTSYKQLTKNVEPGNLENLLKQYIKNVENNNELLHTLQSALQTIKKQNRNHLQKVGFKRYNPFQETGGDQSFVLAVLDDNNNGFIISSLHQRDVTRVYSKRISDGKAENKLSKEEADVLTSTIKDVKE